MGKKLLNKLNKGLSNDEVDEPKEEKSAIESQKNISIDDDFDVKVKEWE